MQDTVEVIINEDGLTCTTTNPLGEKPEFKNTVKFKLSHDTTDVSVIESASAVFQTQYLGPWEQAENNRKTYEIANAKEIANIIRFKPGTIHKARIINNKAVMQ